MDFNISINLDERLSQFRSLTFTKELFDNYYTENSKDNYYPIMDNSDNYYKELLTTRYPTFYFLSNLVDLGRELTNADLYFIANNAYYMKGSIYALKYALENLGISLDKVSYPKRDEKEIIDSDGTIKPIKGSGYYHIRLKVGVTISDGDNYLIKDYINKLAYELLLCNSNELSYAQLISRMEIDTEIIINRTYINSNDLESEEGYFWGDNEETDSCNYYYEPHFIYNQGNIKFRNVKNIFNINSLTTDDFIISGLPNGIYEPNFFYEQARVDIKLRKEPEVSILEQSVDSDDYLVEGSSDYDPEFEY